MSLAVKDINAEKKEHTKKLLLSIDDLYVWFELKRFGFGHAGNVKAVDGVSWNDGANSRNKSMGAWTGIHAIPNMLRTANELPFPRPINRPPMP